MINSVINFMIRLIQFKALVPHNLTSSEGWLFFVNCVLTLHYWVCYQNSLRTVSGSINFFALISLIWPFYSIFDCSKFSWIISIFDSQSFLLCLQSSERSLGLRYKELFSFNYWVTSAGMEVLSWAVGWMSLIKTE